MRDCIIFAPSDAAQDGASSLLAEIGNIPIHISLWIGRPLGISAAETETMSKIRVT